MQGGQRDQAFQLADNLFRDPHRSIVGWAAVDDAVADNGRWRKKASQPSVEPLDCGARIGDLLPTVGLVDQDGVSTVAGNQTRLRADALELAAQTPIHFITSHLEELELDAGRPAIQHQNGIWHCPSQAAMGCALRVALA